MDLEGTVVEEPLGPGVFVLEAADGSRYALKSNDDALLRAGQRVAVKGRVATDAMGIGMTGAPVFEVESYRRLD